MQRMISNGFAGRRSEGTVQVRRARHCVSFLALFATSVLADDAARVSRLESEIQQLRTQIDEQNRRIQRLEAELLRRPVARPGARPDSAADVGRARGTSSSGPQPWHSPAPWRGVAKGMTATAVIAILGEPTSVESVDGLKTLFYRGKTATGTALSGIVNLRDERVVAVVSPAF
jgi:hypothetical protein